MLNVSEDPRDRITELRLQASKQKVVASKHYLKCRTFEKKSAHHSLTIQKHQDELRRLKKRKYYFESKAREIEKKFANEENLEFAQKEIKHRKRKAGEILAQIKACQEDIDAEKKKIQEYEKKAKEWFKKSEETMRECRELEKEAVKIEIKLGMKKPQIQK